MYNGGYEREDIRGKKDLKERIENREYKKEMEEGGRNLEKKLNEIKEIYERELEKNRENGNT